MGAGGDREGGQMGRQSTRVGAVGERVQVVERKGTHAWGRGGEESPSSEGTRTLAL